MTAALLSSWKGRESTYDPADLTPPREDYIETNIKIKEPRNASGRWTRYTLGFII